MEEKELKLRAQLQQKKNAIRKKLKEMGILERKGANTYDNYKYFSEAQYKELFTGLLADAGLELAFNELECERFRLDGKATEGRKVKLRYELIDIDTGYSESTVISGEGADRSDKGIYKAYTGILKYYLANTFMVATGDDPERDDRKPEKKEEPKTLTASPEQIKLIKGTYKGAQLKKLLEAQNVEKVEDIPLEKASEICKKVKEIIERKEKEKNVSNNSGEQHADDEARDDSGDNEGED